MLTFEGHGMCPSALRAPMVLLALLSAHHARPATGRLTTISNTQPRLDSEGKIVNAHDGAVVQDPVSGRYYLYGFMFNDCTRESAGGFDNCVHCALVGNGYPAAYSSADLVHWKLETDAPNQTLAHNQLNLTSFGDQARVIYNPRTKKYVAINRGHITSTAGARVAYSDSPIGPFVGGGVDGCGSLDTGGDAVGSQLSWYADSKGAAYVAYNTAGPPGTLYPARQCMLELAPDWLTSTGRKSCWVARDGFGLEGGAVWERNGRYFWASGNPCCNCEMGGSARVWSIDGDPMGNWSYLTDLNPPRTPMPPVFKGTEGSPGATPASSGTCEIEGEWVGSVYLASGGQALRGGLAVKKLPDGRYNFTESQPHHDRVVGIGTVDGSVKGGVLKITLAEAESATDERSEQEQHPPWIPWVEVHGVSINFGAPIGGGGGSELLSNHTTSDAECRKLCEARDDCTMYDVLADRPGAPCSGGEWCYHCYGRTDTTWAPHPVAGCTSARRVAVPPVPPPSPPTLTGIADAWPGLPPSTSGADGCSRISWGSVNNPLGGKMGSVTWGKRPMISGAPQPFLPVFQTQSTTALATACLISKCLTLHTNCIEFFLN